MRLYAFTNHYLSPIQHGIQTAHVVGELFIKYCNKQYNYSKAADMLFDWAENHKTIIVLNGGFSSNIKNVSEILAQSVDYPSTIFNEGQDEMNGALTVCGVVLPEKVYDARKHLGGCTGITEATINVGGVTHHLSKTDLDIIKLLETHKLA